MGYTTRFKLDWKVDKDSPVVPNCKHEHKPTDKFCSDCGKPVGFQEPDDLIGEFIEKNQEKYYGIDPNGESSESCKWYEHETDMREMSKQFPNILFTMKGEGEESGDIWRRYYLNGKCQVVQAKLVFDDFDRKQLR